MNIGLIDRWGFTFAVGVDMVWPGLYQRIADEARTMDDGARGLVQLCATTDAWSTPSQRSAVGRKCLESILPHRGWSVRILTKHAGVESDYDVVARFRDRVIVGISLPAPPSKSDVVNVTEPDASPIPERVAALKKAHQLGLRTYAMFSPVPPWVASDPESLEELVKIGLDIAAEEFFVEPVNAHGIALVRKVQDLCRAGFFTEAEAMNRIRRRSAWSAYIMQLVSNLRPILRRHNALDKLRFLLHPGRLTPADAANLRLDGEGIVWLDKEGVRSC